VHTETGGESGTSAEFLNSSSDLSTHYKAHLDGTLDSFVDPADRAWANGILEPGNRWAAIATDCGVDSALNPNHITITCDSTDLGDVTQEVTDRQYNAVLYAAWEAKLRYPTSLRYLARHTDISPQSRANCPGERWLADGRLQRLADALGLKTVSI
jgi:N-acetyl-anhydromuramyl-L-alanine amidase AmpD